MLAPGQMPLNPQAQDPGMMYTMMAQGGANPSAAPMAQRMGHQPFARTPIMMAMHPQLQALQQRYAAWQAQNPGMGGHDFMRAMGGPRGLFGNPMQPQTQVPPQGFAATTNPQPGVAY